jgi:S-formylglutathione hydrolase FrmB
MSRSEWATRTAAPALVLLAVLAGAHARPPQAKGSVACSSMPSRVLGHPVKYCVLLPPSYATEKTRRFPILYFLHGLGDNEQTFVRSGAWNLTEDLWEEHRMGEFLIATPAGAASFYINSFNGKARYEDFLMQEFFPEIEKRFRVQAERKTRGIAGVSMGGYGALHLAFKHPELFQSVSANSAALFEHLPEVYFEGNTESAQARLLGSVFGSPVDRAFWDHNDPLALAKTAPLAGLKIYFDCGTEDEYGFFAGAKVLDAELNARRIPHEYHHYPGGHDSEYFAAHLSASLEFQARAFALAVPLH